jgi:hypothetical protein
MATLLLGTLDAQNVGKIINIPNPTANGDAANKAYVDALVEGLNWKDNVRVATTGNINLSSAPATIDGVTLAVNDRVLVKDQTTATQNGIYIFNGSGSAMTRSPDANTASELTNAVVIVDEGTANAGSAWRQTVPNPTIGTDSITFESFVSQVPDASETVKGKIQIATQAEVNAGTNDTKAVTPLKLSNYPGMLKKYATTIGDTSNTQYTITHNLDTQDIVVSIRKASGTLEAVIADWTVTGANTVQLNFAAPPGNNAIRVVVIG